MNISSIITENAKFHPHYNAIICGDDGREYNWMELDELINKFGNSLKKMGVKKGDVVAIYLPNSPEFIITYFAVIRIGAIVLPFNIQFKTCEIFTILNNSGAKVLVGASEEVEQYVIPKKFLFTSLEKIITVGKPINDTFDFYAMITDSSPELETVDCNPNDLACLIYTSGTCGTPKGAMISHGNLFANGNYHLAILHMNDQDLLLSGCPYCHIFFLSSVFGPFMCGAGIVTMKRFKAENALDLMSKYKVTHFAGVPTMFIYLLNKYDRNKWNLGQLRYMLSGGAGMPLDYIKEIEANFGHIFCEAYGITEATSIVAYNRLGHNRNGSVGLPPKGVEVKIVDPKGRQLPEGEIGEILVKGPSVFQGYWRMPEATAEAFDGEWYHTGDLGRLDKDGYLYIVDRLKHMILSGGYNVYPSEVEGIIYRNPKVKEVAVVGIEDSALFQVPKAYVCLNDNMEMTEQELIDFCKQRMAYYKVPRQVEFVAELPKNSTGKIIKRLLE